MLKITQNLICFGNFQIFDNFGQTEASSYGRWGFMVSRICHCAWRLTYLQWFSTFKIPSTLARPLWHVHFGIQFLNPSFSGPDFSKEKFSWSIARIWPKGIQIKMTTTRVNIKNDPSNDFLINSAGLWMTLFDVISIGHECLTI